jgi:uncharacterized protein (UPF0303 family)
MTERPTAAALLAEEQEIHFPWFNAATAWRLGSLIHERAAAAAMPIAFEVSTGEQQLFFAAMPGATPDNWHWVRRKRAVVYRFHHSSLYMKTMLDEAGRTMPERYGLPAQDYASSGGGVPIIVRDTGCIGAVVVSGLTQYDDHDLAVAAIREVIGGLGPRAGR